MFKVYNVITKIREKQCEREQQLSMPVRGFLHTTLCQYIFAPTPSREEPIFIEQPPEASKGNDYQLLAPKSISDPAQIIKRQIDVANGTADSIVPYLDNTLHGSCHTHLRSLIENCCVGDKAYQRPQMNVVYKRLSHVPEFGGGSSVVDRLVTRLQHYTDGLEALIAERTNALLEASQRSEQLLLQLLPGSVAAELKAGRHVAPEAFDCVSICLSDIVGFTAISSLLSPLQVVEVLNVLYTGFDVIVEKHSVYKVETIGDAYMVVSGLPKRIGNKHASEICEFALDAVNTLATCHMPHTGRESEMTGKLKMRIGLHCGPVLAGVVGTKMPRYCLFGNTVHIASVMEHTGEPLRIHASSIFHQFVEECNEGKYLWQERSDGNMFADYVTNVVTKSYWLIGHESQIQQ